MRWGPGLGLALGASGVEVEYEAPSASHGSPGVHGKPLDLLHMGLLGKQELLKFPFE